MHRFLLTFFFFLSCGFNPGYTETLKNFHLNGVLNNVNSEVEQFRCTDDEQCKTLILESKCINRSCNCEKDKVRSSDGSKCLPRATELGSPCEDNVQCSSLLTTGAICENSKCVCKSGYHYLRGNCWKNVDLNGKCFKDEQCFSAYQYVGLECKNGICECRDKYYPRLGSGCRRKRNNGESCNLDEDCPEIPCESMTCGEPEGETFNSFPNTTLGQMQKKLNCPKGTFELNSKCVLELGMKCTKNTECEHIKYALCLDNSICACEPALRVSSENNRECLKVTRGKVDSIARSSCRSNAECEVFGPNSHCKDKRCACKDGTYFETEKKFCWKIKSLKESCTDNKDCYSEVTYAECKDTISGKQCLCQKNYHQKGSKCVPDALEVGDSCEDDTDCLPPNTFCNTTVCACKEHYYLEEGECKPGVGLKLCDTDKDCDRLKNTECKIGDTQCNSKQCHCKGNHINSDNHKYCLPVAKHKEACEESFQCEFHLGNLGECKSKTCECRKGAHYSYGKCHKSKFVKESCSNRAHCFPGNDTNSVICHKGFCRCNYDYELDKNNTCVKTNSATNLKSFSALLTSLLLFLAIR